MQYAICLSSQSTASVFAFRFSRLSPTWTASVPSPHKFSKPVLSNSSKPRFLSCITVFIMESRSIKTVLILYGRGYPSYCMIKQTVSLFSIFYLTIYLIINVFIYVFVRQAITLQPRMTSNLLLSPCLSLSSIESTTMNLTYCVLRYFSMKINSETNTIYTQYSPCIITHFIHINFLYHKTILNVQQNSPFLKENKTVGVIREKNTPLFFWAKFRGTHG